MNINLNQTFVNNNRKNCDTKEFRATIKHLILYDACKTK